GLVPHRRSVRSWSSALYSADGARTPSEVDVEVEWLWSASAPIGRPDRRARRPLPTPWRGGSSSSDDPGPIRRMEGWWSMAQAVGFAIRRTAPSPVTSRRARHARLTGFLAGLALALLPRLVRADTSSPFSPASPGASTTAGLFWLIIVIAGLIFVGVEGALFYAIFAYRERPGRTPARFHRNVRLAI